jgi:predicted CXXCH cytochrome family protein
MFLALPVVSMAAINGDCADCHTMHNSRAGAPMAFTATGTGTTPSLTPFPVLLLTDCVGCHAAGGADAIADFTGSQVPQVYHTDTVDLAGGNFAYIDGVKGAGADDRKGHNVVDILSADATLTGPPGMGRGATMSSMHTADQAVPAATFTCAGNDGCHGVRNRLSVLGNIDNNVTEAKVQGLAAMTGAHHYDVDGKIDGSAGAEADDLNNSYRFLRGLYGLEAADWKNTDASNHNEYYGVSGSPFTGSCEDCHDNSGHGDTLTTTMTTPSHSISGFCSTCHGTFHQDTDSAGSFIRHPTDLILPAKTEYQAYTSYDISGPVARTVVPDTASATVTPGSDVVMCLSCHVAHGSDYAGMLRFDYTTMIAGGGEVSGGCFACHTTKDTSVKTW